MIQTEMAERIIALEADVKAIKEQLAKKPKSKGKDKKK